MTHRSIQMRKILRIGTWNIQSMLQLGKVYILGNELERNRVDICGLSEVRWKGQGHFTTTEGHTIIYSGGDVQGQRGVAVWIHKKIAGTLLEYQTVNDQILAIEISAKPRKLSIVQIYGPTAVSTVESLAQFYWDLDMVVNKIPKQNIKVIMGELNAKVGKQTLDIWAEVVGKGGLGEVNKTEKR